MKKISSKKGFTLAELLIVIAIIAVLVTIAIPVFGAALDKANFAKDVATIRANYAEQLVIAMTTKDNYTVDVSKVLSGINAPGAAAVGSVIECGNVKVTFTSGVPASSTAGSILVVSKNVATSTVTIPVDADVTFNVA